MIMVRSLAVLALVASSLASAAAPAAAAQDAQAATGQPPQRIRDVTVAKGQPCPKSTADEVVVCRTLEDPYRIPKALRNDGPVPAASQSWVNRAATVDQVSRVAGGIPDTCSAVGTGGQSGCSKLWNQQYAADRRAQRDAASAGQGLPRRIVILKPGETCPASTATETVVCEAE